MALEESIKANFPQRLASGTFPFYFFLKLGYFLNLKKSMFFPYSFMNFQFSFFLSSLSFSFWKSDGTGNAKEWGDQDSYCLTEHSRGWLKISCLLHGGCILTLSIHLQIFTNTCINLWANYPDQLNLTRIRKSQKRSGKQTEPFQKSLPPQSMIKILKRQSDYILTYLCFLKGCHATAQHCRTVFANFHEQFFMFPECKREAGPIHNQSMLDNVVFLYSIQGQKSWLCIGVREKFKFCYELCSCPYNKQKKLAR